MPQIALTYPNKLNPDQAELLRKSFIATYTGTGARKVPLILTEGGAAEKLSMSPVDIELIASRRIEKQAICEAFGVPPILIGDSEKTSSWGTGVEQITLGFVRFTLAPMLCRWEEELNRKLFRRAGQFIEFSLDALLRGDSKAKAEAYRAALGGPGSGSGWMSVDEVRKLENLPPLGGESAMPFDATPPAPAAPTPAAAAAATAQAGLLAAVTAMAGREPAASVVNVAAPVVNVAPPAVHIEPAVVNVSTPAVHIEPAVVNVAAPVVNLEATLETPVVNISAEAAPPVVNITNEVTAQAGPTEVVMNHAAESVAEHVRDKNTGEIVRTITTFIAQEPAA
jgi:hypothetical protein